MLKSLIRIALLCSLFIIVSSGDSIKKTIENGAISALDKTKEIGSTGSTKHSTEKTIETSTNKTTDKPEENKVTEIPHCGKHRTPKPTSPLTCYEEATKLIIPANNAFSGKILKELIHSRPSENVMFSSPVVWNALTQVGVAAHGDAYTQIIMKILNFTDTKLVKCYFPRIIAIVMTLPDVEYKFIAKVYSDDVSPLTSDFKKQTKESFAFEPTNLDFQDPKSAKFINQEVAENTDNGIMNFIKPDLLSKLSGVLLVTAVYYQGQWQKPFNPINTKERDFHVSTGKTIKVRTMHQKGTFLYAESSELGAKILEMKYVGVHYSLVIILPNSKQGLNDLVDKMSHPDLVMPALDSVKMKNVDIYLPTFNITVAHRFKGPVEKIYNTKIFHNETARLEDITKCNGTYVSDILQKATFQVDETGGSRVKTPEFNTDVSSKVRDRRTYSFRANRPFLYFIYYDKYIINIGVYYH